MLKKDVRSEKQGLFNIRNYTREFYYLSIQYYQSNLKTSQSPFYFIYCLKLSSPMPLNRLPFYLFFVVIFQLNVTSSHSQELNLTSLTSHPWVDSVFESLSITERINQMLVLDIGNNPVIPYDYPTAYGGVLLSSSGPVSHGNAVNSIQQNLVLPTLIFSYLDEKFGIEMDSIVNFGSTLIFATVTEPYLIYETGQTIAKHSKHLGIHGLFSKNDDILQKENPYHEPDQRLGNSAHFPRHSYSSPSVSEGSSTEALG